MIVLAIAAMFQQPLAPQRNERPIQDTSIFRRLELPAPNRIRTGTGTPGPDYWQQRADYTVSVTLDPAQHRLTGTEVLTYHNNSPDTLRYLWFQLDQNICRPDARGSFLYLQDTRNACISDGYAISDVAAVRGGAPAARGRPAQPEQRVPLQTSVNGTLMRVDLDQPLPPRATLRVAMAYAFVVAEHGSDRNGRKRYGDDWLYTIAQWYPRVAVYDDVRGWNTEQYLGGGEFYLEYGDIDFAITVPRSFVVVGTGALQNRAEVLTAEQIRRLDAALRSDSTIGIIARTEAGSPATRPTGDSPTLTWRFRAQNVRDVAWAAAPNFRWDANGWNGILMQAFFSPAVDSTWGRAAAVARHSIRTYSEQWFPYPYPTATVVGGSVSGMEYPQIVFCDADDGSESMFGCLDHELGHQWFPMIVGSNERLYAWMDEGFNTFINIGSERSWEHAGRPQPNRDMPTQIGGWMRQGMDQPIMLPPDRLGQQLLGIEGYFKPGVGLYIMRHAMLGDSTRFDFAFREYIRRWAFRHPTPADFFRTMEDALGEDLSYFWRGWFFRTDRVDVAVDTIIQRTDTGVTRVVLSSPGTLPMPADARVQYNDGSSDRIRLPVEVWYMGPRYIWVRRFPKPVAAVELDPDLWLPDVNRANNVFPRQAAPAPATP
jgi:hypothetical protein